MFSKLIKIFSERHQRKFIKRCNPILKIINKYDKDYELLTDNEFKIKTEEFKNRFQNGETLDQLLPEAYALVKNASRRIKDKTIIVCGQKVVWNMVHYDVQIIGGIALHENKIAEIATGEGKTLVATLPLYLNSLTGKNCQLVTVNDYLAKRDSEWNSCLFDFLGLSVGCIQNNMDSHQRKKAYNKNITYGTASEFGFDYLRDNSMARNKKEQFQKHHYYCIIDEIDSILIDEARTPLIISGPSKEKSINSLNQIKHEINDLVNRQRKLCNSLIQEVKKEIKKLQTGCKNSLEKLFQVKLGMTKNKTFMSLMEDSLIRKNFYKFEVEMSNSFNQQILFDIKEKIYFIIDEPNQQVYLTQKGRDFLRPTNTNSFILPDLINIFNDIDNNNSLNFEEKIKLKEREERNFNIISEEIHSINLLLKAYSLYERDIHYVVQQDKVVIIDPNTGRAMLGRRWGDGLHQAIEAKENVTIENESKTYASISIQNYFRQYEKLSGMTGTAITEANEFYDIYKLSVIKIPTYKKCIRCDLNDIIYKTRREKFNGIIKNIKEINKSGQPILVGTNSVETSEILSKILKKLNINHNLLNAKYHEREAEIIAKAGLINSVTIATNMAGRGTDIKLDSLVNQLGGLFVLGTERNQSRRIDRQLRGRCARQGDKGKSQFYVSLEDDLMRFFSNESPITKILNQSFTENEHLEHPLLNYSVESAQKKIEQQNYSMRKHLLEYDNVLNQQRLIIYNIRNDILNRENHREIIYEVIEQEIVSKISKIKNQFTKEFIDFELWYKNNFLLSLPELNKEKKIPKLFIHSILEDIQKKFKFSNRVQNNYQLNKDERLWMIEIIDFNWQNHLTEMHELRRSVALRGYGEKDPLNEYRNDSYFCFQAMIENIRIEIIKKIFQLKEKLTLIEKSYEKRDSIIEEKNINNNMKSNLKRNDLCSCGSNKKYKKCCQLFH